MTKKTIELPLTSAALKVFPPFPIVLVTTRSNIITIGQVEYFTFTPLRIGIAVRHTRHSHSLIKKECEFVINIPDAKLIDAVKLCGSISGKNHDKFKEASLEPEKSLKVQSVSISQCRAQIECVVEREIEFEDRTWFIGKVVAARKEQDFTGTEALLCGRNQYMVPGDVIAVR